MDEAKYGGGQQEWKGRGVLSGAEDTISPKHPPVYERLEAIERVTAELDEFVTVLERKLEPLCRPNAPTPAGTTKELDRPTSSLAQTIRQTENRLVAVGWRLRMLIDTLEV